MAHMNFGGRAARPRIFERVIARKALRALQSLETLRRAAERESAPGDEPFGPGWFDSSWELGKGLDVREGLPAEAGLDEWLAVWLAR
jgi:hypothetical protein